MGSPDFGALIESWWGDGSQGNWGSWLIGNASNIVVGTNPPFSVTDFFGFYPKYGGLPLNVNGTLVLGSAVVTGTVTTNGAVVGQFVTGPGIPSGTTILTLGSGTMTLSQNATASGTVLLSIYVKPLLPVSVIGAYVALASASLNQGRWLDSWFVGMNLFVAHFCTLYLRSEGNCNLTAGAAAMAGLKQGITVSASAGGVSQNLERTPGLDSYAAWNETAYGAQLATTAKLVGMGPLWCY